MATEAGTTLDVDSHSNDIYIFARGTGLDEKNRIKLREAITARIGEVVSSTSPKLLVKEECIGKIGTWPNLGENMSLYQDFLKMVGMLLYGHITHHS